ncbi:secondary metabolite protein [Streptomyces sp. NPDC001315]|uniref:secondary metabolite protein n=1 Tax=Streptomyces sp. NPDC001315 TaxID=3364562 RepID=UPI003686BDC6
MYGWIPSQRKRDARRHARQREERLRAQCLSNLAGVRIPDPFSLDEFCTELSKARGRDLFVQALPELGGTDVPCGLWIASESSDFIFHAAAVSEHHRQQVIRHELGHLLLEHDSSGGFSDLLAALPQDIDKEAVASAFGRTAYSTQMEQDAELIATMLPEIFPDLLDAQRATSPDAIPSRIDAALTHPRRNRS